MNNCLSRRMMVATFSFLIACSEIKPSLAAPTQEIVAEAAPPQSKAETTGSSATPKDPQSISDHRRLQGSWHVVTLASGPGNEDHIVFDGDTIYWSLGASKIKGTFVVNATRNPKQINLRLAGLKDAPPVFLGLYEFQKNLLFICLSDDGKKRPTKLAPGKGHSVLMFYPSAQRPKHEGRKDSDRE